MNFAHIYNLSAMVQTPHCKVLFAFVRFRNSGRNGSYNNRLLVHSQSKFLRIFGFLFSNKKLAFSLSSIKLFILMHNLFFFYVGFHTYALCIVQCIQIGIDVEFGVQKKLCDNRSSTSGELKTSFPVPLSISFPPAALLFK